MKRTIVFLSLALLFLSTYFLLGSTSPTRPEPLADPISLSQLIGGETLAQPIDEHYATFHGRTVTPPSQLTRLVQTSRVLGITSPDRKRIEVDLTNQRVYAYEGMQLMYNFLVSTGKWGPTPTGMYRIWAKVRSQRMTGGNKEDNTYYYLPNVPYVQFFYNSDIAKMRGYSFHGTYWHDNFGHPMSHGCVNMRTEDAEKLFAWTTPVITNPKAWATLASADNPGTVVVIYGTPPAQ